MSFIESTKKLHTRINTDTKKGWHNGENRTVNSLLVPELELSRS